MHSKKTVLIVDLMNAANMELIRLDFRSSALSRHDKEFRRFCNYCTENGIQTYDAETGPRYFRSRFGLNIGDANIKLNRQQLDARNSIRFLDDIFQFGYALRYSHHDYTLPQKYANLLNEYLAWCQRNNNSAGTIDVKRTKIRQFLSNDIVECKSEGHIKYRLAHSTSVTEPFEGQFDIRLRPFHGRFHVFKHSKADEMKVSIAEVNVTSPE